MTGRISWGKRYLCRKWTSSTADLQIWSIPV